MQNLRQLHAIASSQNNVQINIRYGSYLSYSYSWSCSPLKYSVLHHCTNKIILNLHNVSNKQQSVNKNRKYTWLTPIVVTSVIYHRLAFLHRQKHQFHKRDRLRNAKPFPKPRAKITTTHFTELT